MYILGALLFMEVADGLLTSALIEKEIAWEANPLLYDIAGKPYFPVLKIAGGLVAIIILWDIHRHHPRLAFWTASVFVLIYTGIAGWNLHLLLSNL